MNVPPPTDAAAMAEWRVTTDASETDTGAFLKVRSYHCATNRTHLFSTVATLRAGRTPTDELTVFIAGFERTGR